MDTDFKNLWLRDARIQLDAIMLLPRDWEAICDNAPDPAKYAYGWWILVALSKIVQFDKPHINPTRSGGVQFEWEYEDRYLEVEVETATAAVYLYSDKSNRLEIEGEIDCEDDLYELTKYIGMCHGGTEGDGMKSLENQDD